MELFPRINADKADAETRLMSRSIIQGDAETGDANGEASWFQYRFTVRGIIREIA